MKNKIKNIFKSIGIILLLLCFTSIMFSVFNINLKALSEKEYLLYTVLFELILLAFVTIVIFMSIALYPSSKDCELDTKYDNNGFKISFRTSKKNTPSDER